LNFCLKQFAVLAPGDFNEGIKGYKTYNLYPGSETWRNLSSKSGCNKRYTSLMHIDSSVVKNYNL